MNTNEPQNIAVTDIGSTKPGQRRKVTRVYEDWELPFIKNVPGHTYHNYCERCGCEIVGQPSNCIIDGKRLVYSIGWEARICWPCKREENRIYRLDKRRQSRVKSCIVCGAVFSGQRSDVKYCSNACKQKHYRNEKY